MVQNVKCVLFVMSAGQLGGEEGLLAISTGFMFIVLALSVMAFNISVEM
jgi:hypothetical protein